MSDNAMPAQARKVFVNRNLRMDCIAAVGFDMDYTLARYGRERLEQLAHTLTLQRLVSCGYPQAILALPYQPNFIIRGLVVDKALGNLIKLDRHNHPCRVYHGTTAIGKIARRSLYRREHLAFCPPRFVSVDTLFSLPEVCLYANLVSFFDARGDSTTAPNYAELFDDIRRAIDTVHRDNSLKSAVRANLEHYLEKDDELAQTLTKLKQGGKKLFIITNSLADYTHAVMSHVLGAGVAIDGRNHWTSYFDIVISGAKKPDFFVSKAPFITLEAPENSPLDQLCIHLQGGNLKQLEYLLGFGGEEVLYVGDHIFGDILRSKKSSLWRTALVVEELDQEILQNVAQSDMRAELLALEQRLVLLDQDLLSTDCDLTNDLATAKQRQDLLDDLEKTRDLEDTIAAAHNPIWGRVFKEDHENSRFGEQVCHYACLYTSRVSNFLRYPSTHYFRSPRDVMPHERA